MIVAKKVFQAKRNSHTTQQGVMKWNKRRMSDEEKDLVRSRLRRRVHEMAQKITEENVTIVTEYRTLARELEKSQGPTMAEAAWSWIAEQQEGTEGMVADALERRSTGTGSSVIPKWRWYTRVLSGWQREGEISEEDVRRMMESDQVLKHLVQEETGRRWEDWCEEGEREDEEEAGCLRLSEGTVRKAWYKAKRMKVFQGKGGYSRFLEAVATLMVGGEVEGGMGGLMKEDPRKAGWWQAAVETGARVWGEEAEVVEVELLDWTGIDDHQVGTLLAGEVGVVMVVVDWMSCTQSLRKAVQKVPGVEYVGMDIQEWVFSHSMRGWVRNVPIDLTQIEPALVWATVEQEIQHRYQAMVKVKLLLLAMSPCCKTFSKADSSNSTRGHNYRLHGEANPDRPPRDNHSEKGIEAAEADEMVMQGIDFAIWVVNSQPIPGQGAAFYMENPVGSLWRRPYMKLWEETGMVTRHEVHYCAYDHFYHKPTHIWTNMEWTPKGSTGTGLCERRCKGGRPSALGVRWVHQYKIAQASWQAKGGRGRKAHKNMMPEKLHRELLEAAIMHSASEADRRGALEAACRAMN